MKLNFFYKAVMSHDIIYSLSYVPIPKNWNVLENLEDNIIEIQTKKLEWSKDKNTFIYIWGWPGPDYNIYTIDNYGKYWAFTKEEIMEAWNGSN